MALNPVVYTEKVVRSFLRYQLTAYRFADGRLDGQMRRLLSLDETRRSPLLKGPFVSLSRPFRQGAAVAGLVAEGVFHPHMRERIPAGITHLYGHQEEAVRAVRGGRTTLVSTGTGSGKTECFLYPVISRCLELRDEGAAPGISAVIVYPMNALAEDQLGRLRGLLAGTGITFGMYVGKTPEAESDVAGIRLPAGASRADYEAKLAAVRAEKRGETVYPAEEVCSREVMRSSGKQPRILLTNVKQLELLLTRGRDVELFAGARLDFLVFDEAHTFTGAQGAETACLIRRLRSFCGKDADETVCVATSATIADPGRPDAARDFAARFFGVSPGAVTTVGEAYEEEVWAGDRAVPPPPAGAPADLLAACVTAVDDEADPDAALRAAYRDLAGADLPGHNDVPGALHAALSLNELVYQINALLDAPRPLDELPAALEERVGRKVSEEEVLAWLTLGAAARADARPLLRPVVHGFVRGISGAVVSFPEGGDEPRLWLAAEDEVAAAGGDGDHAHFPTTTCTTCGQHYFLTFLKDFTFTRREPEGGEASGEGRYWEPLEKTLGGDRAVLTDRVVGDADDGDIEEHNRTFSLHFCRRCGAAHPEPVGRCGHCGAAGDPVVLYAIRTGEKYPGMLTSCLSCGSTGRRVNGRYREPAREVRASNVADVHVLAQDMVHHSTRPRLLVFADNRQDAAFQAGWMKDHARRFRLRALMAEALREGTRAVGDVAHHLSETLQGDPALSRALIPEVWNVARPEGTGERHNQERLKFLRIQVLREVTLSARQSLGLEPWGRMVVDYLGLESSLPWIQDSAHRLGLPPDEMREGVASVLDYFRRKRALHDPDTGIFGRYWMDGDQEVQRGYLPQLGSPAGTKLRRSAAESDHENLRNCVVQWLSDKGDTVMRQIAAKWGVPEEERAEFLEGLFAFLAGAGLLVPVTLRGSHGNTLPALHDLYQVDGNRLLLSRNRGIYRCGSCRRGTTRRTPHGRCPAWRCQGTTDYAKEDSENYDLALLDGQYAMLRPEEHTAMVPHGERERLENLFKGDTDAVNCFVCTPTLEMGVDIGKLDAVLMRNVPPLPANYWQRAGRAGRRHRMAVDLTYCRGTSHDRAYFAEPLKLLTGRVDPPAFNLRNEVMVAKHVHATVITRLNQIARDPGRAADEQRRVEETLRDGLPTKVAHYLFDGGFVRQKPFDLSPLRQLIADYAADLAAYTEAAFHQNWPQADVDVAAPGALRGHIDAMADCLQTVVQHLRARLSWAMDQSRRLEEVKAGKGDLEPPEEALYRRCDRLVKRLKGTAKRKKGEAEGYDDVNTFGVLAAEGFLPGYGLEIGSVVATAEIPFWRSGSTEFALPRPPATALREYVPGNLIYANGNRFAARHFHLGADEDHTDQPTFAVSAQNQAVREVAAAGAAGGAFGTDTLPGVPVCDVDLVHLSHISDDEDYRFQLAVATYGMERGRHGGGTAYRWGEQPVLHRRGVHLRLVNVGATSTITGSDRFGYPVCTVCGHSASPLSSDRQRDDFAEKHEERCGQKPNSVAFYADVVADTLSLPACPDQRTAYSVLEALRFAAAQLLDMHLDDLQILVIGHLDRDDIDGYLWDPMPGGSGLLEQITQRFDEVVQAARAILRDCPAECESSCIDCLQTFRNAFYHNNLNRSTALEAIDDWGGGLAFGHDIPPKQPAAPAEPDAQPVNDAERNLQELLRSATFPEGSRNVQLQLGPAVGTTTPDILFRAGHHDEDEGVCVYLDGLSQHLHGNPETAAKDAEIRTWLRNNGYDVVEITAHDLHDRDAMVRHFRKLAGYLRQDNLKRTLKADTSWFEHPAASPPAATGTPVAPAPDIIEPAESDKYTTALPLIPLQIAAGAFGDPQSVEGIDRDCQWVRVNSAQRLRKGMFVAQVTGKSMEPTIPDGAYCIFAAPVEGTRQNKIVLAQLTDQADPETGNRYTVKRYSSEKAGEGDTWRHFRITLKPDNPDFEAIELSCDDEGAVDTPAAWVANLP